MFTKDHQHHIDLVVALKSKLGKLYMHLMIQAFGASLLSIFVPIYLLRQGYSLQNVFLFLFIQWATFSLSAPLVGEVIQHVGVKGAVVLRTPLLITALLGLTVLDSVPWLAANIWWIAILLGFSSCIYTLSVTSVFANFMDLKNRGEETGRFTSLPKLATIAGPFIGGLIATSFGFPILFMSSVGIMMLAVIPLLVLKQKVNHPDFKFKDFLWCFSRFGRLFYYLNWYGMKGFVFYIVLPVAIFLLGRSELLLGGILSLITLLGVLAAVILGKSVDTVGAKKMAKVGGVVTAIFLAGLGWLVDSSLLLYASLLAGFVSLLLDIPFETVLYREAKQSKKPLTFLVFKEFSFIGGRSLLFLILILFAEELEMAFYLGAGSSLVFVLF